MNNTVKDGMNYINELLAERDQLREQLEAAKVEIARLKANIGCARNQASTQFCAEAVALRKELDTAQADTRRLDWLELTADGINWQIDRWGIINRDAIDAAMKEAAP